MKMLKGLVISLVLLGISSSVLAWNIKVYNKTPFGIMAKAKSWGGALNGDWTVIPAGQFANVHPGGADCIDGMWVQVDMPGGQGYTDLGYFNFKFAPMSPCQNTSAVVGVEPVVADTHEGGYGPMGTLGGTKYVLKRFKFFVGHVHGDVANAQAATDIQF